MSGILAELQRRRVFRVAGLYAVTSWLLLQVADVLVGLLRLPDWTLRFVLLLLVLGFPVAMTLSWVFDMTPEGLRRSSPDDPDPERLVRPCVSKSFVAAARGAGQGQR